MRFAVISDVQGNMHALEAVLSHIDADRGRVDGIVSAGDAVGRGPHPNEVLESLQRRTVTSVRGNYDDAIAYARLGSGTDFADADEEEADAAALAWTRRALSPANMEHLRGLPKDVMLSPAANGLRAERDTGDERAKEYRRTFFIRALFGGLARPGIMPGKRILLVHGSPRAMNEFIRVETAASILSVIARDAQADVIISGHAGVSFQREYENVTFIGVGGVSGDFIEYAMVNIAESVDVQFVQVAYDFAAYRRAVMESGLPISLASMGGH